MIDKLDSLDVGEKVLEGKAAWKYAEDILQLVSRTFALNIQVLRGKLHRSILLAYLYLRIADTVEDDPDMKATEKDRVLALFADVFKTGELETEKIRTFVAALPESWHGSEDPNKDLCVKSEVVVPLLKSLPKNYQKPVCNVVIEMCGGMAKFALRQEAALSAGWFTLANVGELDEYCYYVAGIVGKLLTKLFSADTCFISAEREAELSKLDVSFGLALQVVNIVKDCVEDSGRRVCFIPEEICKRHGFAHPSELFAVGADAQKCGAVLSELVEKAWHHLDDAIAYTKLIPNIKMRTRLFCLWPLFMAAENLSLIGDGVSVFTSDKKVKITRDTVKRIVKETSMHFYSDKWIDQAYARIKRNI
ncbi:squalene synthase [Fibrobacter sp. UWB4]|uniref:squalene/phytoene synthase family protein n=1 Tax=Fibrobacter sp. UWB4 TaxID=1964356 RepID=UPI000B528BC1|nr:squalene/phytoene synthase family protein [Fibrobacter sp. UWB4]OWV20104.1 squalene synthase [Fibrobacter sp. UWB4]